ncbi:MAG TPA: DUF1508 domain-containing protein [Mycobacterium sp.]
MEAQLGSEQASARNGIESVRKNAADAQVVESWT